jgi:hypothetical protein
MVKGAPHTAHKKHNSNEPTKSEVIQLRFPQNISVKMQAPPSIRANSDSNPLNTGGRRELETEGVNGRKSTNSIYEIITTTEADDGAVEVVASDKKNGSPSMMLMMMANLVAISSDEESEWDSEEDEEESLSDDDVEGKHFSFIQKSRRKNFVSIGDSPKRSVFIRFFRFFGSVSCQL